MSINTHIAVSSLTTSKNRSSIRSNLSLDCDLNGPGLYAWFVTSEGAAQLSDALGMAINPGIIYAGQAGATKWPSGIRVAQTLKGRLERNHIRGKRRNSTFRRTLGAIIQSTNETILTAWMQEQLSVATYVYEDRDTLMALEHSVLEVLDPPLNLQGMAKTPARLAIKQLRRPR